MLITFPTGDQQGKNVATHQAVTLAAMEGLFESIGGAPIAILGQPDMEKKRLDNPLLVPKALSFLTYRRWEAIRDRTAAAGYLSTAVVNGSRSV